MISSSALIGFVGSIVGTECIKKHHGFMKRIKM
jgi:hypothetical protein